MAGTRLTTIRSMQNWIFGDLLDALSEKDKYRPNGGQ